MRRLAYAIAGTMLLLGMIEASYRARQSWPFVVILCAIPLSGLLSLPRRDWRPGVLAGGAAIVALASSDAPELWPTVAALVFLSVAEDPSDSPWVGPAGGVAGSSLSLLVADGDNIGAVVATAFGAGAALLLRTWTRSRELVGETEELRGQAAWLEQRTAVARELHDVVGHHVTAIVVQAEAGQVGDPREALRTIGGIGRTALAELDSLVVHLRDPGAPLTVSAPPRLLDIDELLAQPLRRAGVAVDIRLGDQLDLRELDVLTVYRIAQEAMTNVSRHAQARQVWVEVTREKDIVRLVVSDDGVGPPAVHRRGSGLVGIEERVSSRGGTVELLSRPGGGAILDVSLMVSRR